MHRCYHASLHARSCKLPVALVSVRTFLRSCASRDWPLLLSVVRLRVIKRFLWIELNVYPLLRRSPSLPSLPPTNTIKPAKRLCCTVAEVEAPVDDFGYTKGLLGDALRDHLLARAIPLFKHVFPCRSDRQHATRSSCSRVKPRFGR